MSKITYLEEEETPRYDGKNNRPNPFAILIIIAIVAGLVGGTGSLLVLSSSKWLKTKLGVNLQDLNLSRTTNEKIVLEESKVSKKEFAARKEKAAKALSKADRDKLIREESEKLKAHITSVVKQKQAEKKEQKGEEHKEHSHPHEQKEQPAHSHTEKGQEHTDAHGAEHRHEGGNDPKHIHSREGNKHEK